MPQFTKTRRMGRQRLIAEHLAGVTTRVWGADVAEAVGLNLKEFWEAAESCRWFTCFAAGAFGYTLTPEGMAALADPTVIGIPITTP